MLTASRELKAEAPSGESLEQMMKELLERIEFIQRSYEQTWQSHKNEIEQAVTFYHSHKYKSIEQIVKGISSYHSAKEIMLDFKTMRKFWKGVANENNFDPHARNAYLLSMCAMEALMIEAFAQKQKAAIEPSRNVRDFLPAEKLSVVDVKAIGSEIIQSFKSTLPGNVFSITHNEEFKSAVALDLNAFIAAKKNYKQSIKKLQIKPISDEKHSDDAEKCRAMMAMELSDAVLMSDVETVSNARSLLVEKGAEALGKSIKDLDNYLTACKKSVVYPVVDTKSIPALSDLSDQVSRLVVELNTAIASIKVQNQVKQAYAEARKALLTVWDTGGNGYDFKTGLKCRLNESIENQRKKWIPDSEATATCEYLQQALLDLNKSLNQKEGDEFPPTDVSILEAKKRQLEQYLLTLTAEIQGIVKAEAIAMVDSQIANYRASFVSDLTKRCTQINPMPSIQESMRERAVQRDQYWEQLTVTAENVTKLTQLQEDWRANVHQEKHSEKSSLLQKRADQLAVKIKAYQSSVAKPEPVMEEKIGPRIDSQRGGLFRVAPQTTVPSTEILEKLPQGFFKKPWVRALAFGIGMAILAGLAATGVGAIMELAVASIITGALAAGGMAFSLGTLGAYGLIKLEEREQKPQEILSLKGKEGQKELSKQGSSCSTRSLPFHARDEFRKESDKELSSSCFGRLFSRRKGDFENQTDVRLQYRK